MNAGAATLLIAAAAVHAWWNYVGKSERPSAAFFLVANSVGLLLLAPVFIAHVGALGSFPVEVWILIGATGVFQAAYYASLAAAYRSGSMSVAYPMARSVPVVLVTVANALLGRSHQVSALCVAGIVLVVAGGFLLPLRRVNEARWRDYLHPVCLFALLAAIGTTGYSMVDDSALRLLRTAPSTTLAGWRLALVYSFLECASSSVILGLFMLLCAKHPSPLEPNGRAFPRGALVAGLGIHLAYTLVLVSMTLAENVVYVMVFRQLSIPIGAVLGFVMLREPRHRPKLAGIVLMFSGVVLAGLG